MFKLLMNYGLDFLYLHIGSSYIIQYNLKSPGKSLSGMFVVSVSGRYIFDTMNSVIFGSVHYNVCAYLHLLMFCT